MAGPKGEVEGPFLQSAVQALITLRGEPFMTALEGQLEKLWTPTHQQPVKVFEQTLASRSITCIAVLFSNLAGVNDAGLIYSKLKQASRHRLQYFTHALATPYEDDTRPDHTRWFAYTKIDTFLRGRRILRFSARLTFLRLGRRFAGSGKGQIRT